MTQRPSQSAWSAGLASVIAGEVRRYRALRDLSAQQLADRCSEVGMDVPRSVIANLESGRRAAVSVAELLVLAKALEVPPVALIFPAGYEREVEGLPGIVADPYDFAFWAGGESPLSQDFSEQEAKNFKANPISGMRRVSVWVDEYIDIQDRHVKVLRELTQAYRELEASSRERQAVDSQLSAFQERSRSFEQRIDSGEMTAEELEDAKRFIEAQNALISEFRLLSEQWARAQRRISELDPSLSLLEEMAGDVAIQARQALRAVAANGWLIPEEVKELSFLDNLDMNDRDFLKAERKVHQADDGQQ